MSLLATETLSDRALLTTPENQDLTLDTTFKPLVYLEKEGAVQASPGVVGMLQLLQHPYYGNTILALPEGYGIPAGAEIVAALDVRYHARLFQIRELNGSYKVVFMNTSNTLDLEYKLTLGSDYTFLSANSTDAFPQLKISTANLSQLSEWIDTNMIDVASLSVYFATTNIKYDPETKKIKIPMRINGTGISQLNLDVDLDYLQLI